jgi:hypothetical protein
MGITTISFDVSLPLFVCRHIQKSGRQEVLCTGFLKAGKETEKRSDSE